MKTTLAVCLVMFAGCAAFFEFSERMIPTFILPLFDENNDGVLKHNELEVVRSHLPSFGFTQGESQILMSTADRNKDGALDEAEFKELYQQIMAEQFRRIEEQIN